MGPKRIDAILRISADVRAGLQGLGQLRDQVQGVEKVLRSARTALAGLVGTVVGAAGVRSVAEMADAYSSLSARLKVATRSQQEFDQARAQSVSLSRQYLAPLNETVTLYTRLLRAVQPLGGGTREAQVATEALLASLKINGSTAAESASAILQFSQALGSGALRGEEFNAIAEAAAPLLEALARGLAKPREQLKALAEQGKLTTGAVLQALAKELPELRRQAGAIPETIAGSAQQVRDAFGQFVGRSAEGSVAVRALIGVLQALAQNIEPVVKALIAMATLIAAMKLAAFAQGLYAMGAAAAAGATGLTAVGLALRGILGVLTGPVGLIVLVASLAAAWLGLDRASQKAQARTLDGVRAERAKLAAEVEAFDRRNDNAGRNRTGKENPAAFAFSNTQRARLARLDAEIAELERKTFEDMRRADKSTFGDQGIAELQDPRTREEFFKKYPTRQSVQKELADERAAFIVAQDRAIAQARLKGDEKAARELQAQKLAHLAEFAKTEAEALRKYDKDTIATRLAQAKDLYDQRADLVRDALAREQQLNQQAFEQGVLDAQTYLKERARLNDEQAALDLADLAAQLGKVREAYSANLKLPTAGLDANERRARQEALLDQAEKIAKLEADIEKRKRDQLDTQRAIVREAERLGEELRRQRDEIDIQLTEATGTPLSKEQIERRVTAQFAAQLDRMRQLGDEGPVLTLIDVEVTRQQLAQVEREFNRALNAMQLREQALNQEAAAGRLSEAEAERQVLSLRRQEVQELTRILDLAEALAQTPEDQQRIAGYRQRLKAMQDLQTALDQTARSSAINALSTALNDIVTGAKSGKAALLDMVRSFSGAMVQAINQQLAKELVDDAIKAIKAFAVSRGGSNDAGLLQSLVTIVGSYFHEGGVVGAGNQAQRALPAAAFAFAPRYHSGGIAGLRGNEVPAILQRGEEVLARDDPRHVRNLGAAAGGQVTVNSNVSITTEAAGSGGITEGQARQFGAAVRSAILTVVADQMRPGGILQNVKPV